ncbi:NADP-dependent oxidoreductase [Parvibaculaceae bacterium PLY_AMNH_Bact1]|nr:NADP-dependent oxidoreductase [Parvibaculaceae bacterium PLY_AMNH_Bact1]
MAEAINRQILLVETPKGKLGAEHFKMAETTAPTLSDDGTLLLRTHYISLDAANRAWMQGATYRDAVESGQVMAGGAIAEVIDSKSPDFSAGDLVFADTGWQDYAAVPAKGAQKVPAMEPKTHLLSVYGVAGLTAYFGLLNCATPKAGETILVSAAAGSVGTLVGQIAKAAVPDCTVIGIAGSDEKCQWLKDELGFDATVNYKTEPVFKALKAVAPQGIDVYFDNVGGDILEAALFRMNNFGRIACCGAVSQYDGAPPSAGPRGVPGLIVTKRLNLRGFIMSDFPNEREKALKDLEGWVAEGKIKVQEDIIDGLENTPAALIGLLAGENRGKRMVKVV